MKIWNGYGSEHSMNLVLIGRFKKVQDAVTVEKNYEKLRAQASKDDFDPYSSGGPEDLKFSDEMLSLMRSLDLNTLALADMWQFGSEHHLSRKDDQITVTTDEAEVSVFVKLFIEAGAKVEVFSAHDYPSQSDDAT